jgi:hypothetical protein
MTTVLFVPLVMLFSLPSLHLCTQCDGGIAIYLSGVYSMTRSVAFYDTASNSGDKLVEMKGSYLADSTGIHTIYCWSQTYDTSSWFGVNSSSALWWETSASPAYKGEWPTIKNCVQDYRYDIALSLSDSYLWVKCSIAVTTPMHSKFDLEGHDYIQTCQENGCRERDYSRSPYDCKPSPTRSKSPSPTHSQSPPPTPSNSPPTTATNPFTTHFRGLNRARLVISLNIFVYMYYK